jgi:hypothetical protein
MAIAITIRPWLPDPSMRSAPQTLEAAITVADARGLFHNTDQSTGGPIGRLIVSDRQVTRERASYVRMNDPDHVCWVGTVAVYYPAHQMVDNYDAQHSVFWGNLFVYGDPAIIEQLTGLRVEECN